MKHVAPPPEDSGSAPKAPSLRSKTVSSAIWNIAASSSTQLVSLLVFILLARQLSLDEFGVVMLAVLVINFFTLFVKEGVQEHLIQSTHWDKRFVSTAFWIMLVGGLLLTLLIAFVVAPIFGYFYGLQLEQYLQVLAPSIFFGAASTTNAAETRRAFNFRTMALRNFANGLLSGVFALVLFWMGFGAWSLIWSRLAAAVGAAIILWLAAPFRPSLTASLADAREITRFSVPIISSRALSYFGLKVAELGLAFVIGPAALAVFRVAGRVNEALTALFLNPIVAVALSTFSHAGRERVGATLIRLNIVLCAIAIPVYFGGAAISSDFVVLFFGEKWHQAGLIMSIIMLGAVPTIVRSLIPAALKAADATNQLYRFSAVEVGVSIVSTAATVWGGPLSVAVGNTVGQYASLSLNRGVLKKGLGLHVFDILKAIMPYIAAALAMFLLVESFAFATGSWAPWPRMIASIALGGLLYPLLLILFARPALRQLVRELRPVLPKSLRAGADGVLGVLERWP